MARQFVFAGRQMAYFQAFGAVGALLGYVTRNKKFDD